MNPAWIVRTGRLVLSPVSGEDLVELVALKGDPGVYGLMLGGIVGPVRVAEELAADIAAWSRTGVGIWMVRDQGGPAIGLTGVQNRADGRGMALRFAFRPAARGRGLAREAAGAALRFGHDQARIPRIIAVAREDNLSSRTVLGAIGMRVCDRFLRDGATLIVFESVELITR